MDLNFFRYWSGSSLISEPFLKMVSKWLESERWFFIEAQDLSVFGGGDLYSMVARNSLFWGFGSGRFES